MFKNAVFQGGGVKGIAYVGALERLGEEGVSFNAVSGSSAGAIVASLYAAGFSSGEMKQVLMETDFAALLDPFPFKLTRFYKNRGLNKGDELYKWIYALLQEKGKTTFSDFRDIDLKIIATDLTNREMIVLDSYSYPRLKVAEAVRMSVGIPLVFRPYEYGEKLMVDGGVLSNFPLFTFTDDSSTLGFKLIAGQIEVPTPPKGIIDYATALVNTMLEAHDKDYEVRRGHTNVISIDNAGIPATRFDISDSEIKQLYGNGYFAASKFIEASPEAFRPTGSNSLTVFRPTPEPYKIYVPKDFDENAILRISIATAFRIYVDGKYLLVKGKRIDQFQPVGGVLKRFDSANKFLRELNILDDDMLPIDPQSFGDLRLRVPFKSISRFFEWYATERERETSPWREFYEEMVRPGIVPHSEFEYVNFERTGSHIEGIRFSQHFKCFEILVQEIYELEPTPRQLEILRALQISGHPEVFWAERDLIIAKGYDSRSKTDVARISENSAWML